MMTCKQVSTLLSSGQLADAPLTERLAVRMHLAMCRHCTAFTRLLEALAGAARAAAQAFERETPPNFESTVASKLGGSGGVQ